MKIKKIISKMFLAIFVLLVLAGAWFIYILFNGSPFEKHKIKQELTKYLAEKYPFETVISEVDYSFKLSTTDKRYYDASAYVKNNPNIKFNVYPSTERQKAHDYLINALWEQSLNEELTQYIEDNLSRSVILRININSDKFIDEYVPKSEIPNVQSMLQELRGKIEVSIYVKREFDVEQDYQKMFEVIDYLIKDKNIYPKKLVFSFNNEQKQNNSKDYLKSYTRFELAENDINNITNQNDLIKYKD